jgi:hypothetical protein
MYPNHVPVFWKGTLATGGAVKFRVKIDLMFAVFVEVDNSGESREDRFRGLREDLAPAMKLTPGFQSGVFASNEEAHTGLMLVVYDSEANARAVASRIAVGTSPRPGVTITRVEVIEVAASV